MYLQIYFRLSLKLVNKVNTLLVFLRGDIRLLEIGRIASIFGFAGKKLLIVMFLVFKDFHLTMQFVQLLLEFFLLLKNESRAFGNGRISFTAHLNVAAHLRDRQPRGTKAMDNLQPGEIVVGEETDVAAYAKCICKND